jgi:hypothetical protein
MVILAIRALNLEYLVKILNWGRSRSWYILPTPTSPKIPSDSDTDSTALLHFGKDKILWKFSMILLKVGLVYQIWIEEYGVEAHKSNVEGEVGGKDYHLRDPCFCCVSLKRRFRGRESDDCNASLYMWVTFTPVPNSCISIIHLTSPNSTHFDRVNGRPRLGMLICMSSWPVGQFWGKWRLTLSFALLHGAVHSLAAFYTLQLA